MNESNLNNKLEALRTIQSAEVPPFLLTRIRQKIEAETQNKATPGLQWSLAISLIALLIVNLVVISNYRSTLQNKNNLAKVMELLPNNNFYND